jgi:hypothetical protein
MSQDMDKFFSIFGKAVLVLIVVAALGGGGYYLGKSGKINLGTSQESGAVTTTNPNPEPTNTVETAVTPTSTPSSTIKTKTVTAGLSADSGLSFTKYTIQIPEGWVENHTYENTGTAVDTLTITKGNYQIKIFQAATGGALCLYPGDAPFEGPSSTYDTFVQLTTADGITLRRGTTTETNGTKRGYTLCQKSTENSYGQPTGFGHTSFSTPVTPDEMTLKEMDTMITSLKKI